MYRVLLVLLGANVVLATSPVVDTFYGPVEGFGYELSDGNKANIFLGIPFAKPPVGELRFEKPKKLDKWTEVLETKEFGPSCQPHHRSFMYGPNYSEDCLTMNIMAPATKSADPQGYPVMVYIYGGAFELGSSSTLDYRNISENFVREGVVFVTFNYRLSAFGFFSTGDHYMPGNLGLWDQAMALHFIQEVISDFGGNPNKVTISGESAGGASVSALTFSPHSNSLFHQAIAMSGSIYSPWAKSERVVQVSHELAKTLGCSGQSEEILYCMREKSVDEIMDGIEKIGPTHDHLFPYKFHPRFDGEFFMQDLETVLKNLPKIPLMAGVTSMEGGLMSMTDAMPALCTFGIPPAEWKTYSADNLRTFIETKTLKNGDPEELKSKLIEFYVDRPVEGKEGLDWVDALDRFTLLGSDLHYVFPIFEEAMDKVQNDIPVYLYVEEHVNPAQVNHFPIKGPMHGNELIYLFGLSFLAPFEPTDDDRAFQKNILEGFISFAKTGKPTVNGTAWTPVSKHKQEYMEFAPVSQMKDGFMKESIDFWKQNMARKDFEADHSEL